MSDSVNNEKKKKRRILIIAAVTVALAVLIFLFGNRGKAQAGDGMTEAAVTKMTIENTLEFDGEITGSLEEDLLPHTSYYLEEVNVKEGQALAEDGVILTYTNGYTMTAPYNCVVIGWDLPDEDEQLTSDHYVTIAGTDVMKMEISVSESDVSKLKVGDEATVTVDAAGSSYDAEVSYISQAGDYSGGNSTFAAELTFDNDGKLKLGMSGSASVTLERAEDVLALPVSAVSARGGTSYVTLRDGSSGSGTLTEVETGISNGSFIEIRSGLSEGDTVIYKAQESSSSDQSGRGSHDGMGGGPDGMQGGGGMPGGSSGGGAPGGSGNGNRQNP